MTICFTYGQHKKKRAKDSSKKMPVRLTMKKGNRKRGCFASLQHQYQSKGKTETTHRHSEHAYERIPEKNNRTTQTISLFLLPRSRVTISGIKPYISKIRARFGGPCDIRGHPEYMS